MASKPTAATTQFYESAEEIAADFRSGELEKTYPMLSRAINLILQERPKNV